MNGVAASKSIIVDPADGKIPYKPEALKQRDENFKNRATADPDVNCDQPGVPRATYLNSPMEILQSPGNFAIVYQEAHSYQIAYPNSRPHFEGIDWWMGDSRGHWEGKTYVIDVTDLTSLAWLDEAGNFGSDKMHIVSRYTMTGPNTIRYEALIDDPDTYTRPWTMRVTLERAKPGTRIIEDECLDDEDGVWHKISPYAPQALLHNEYRRWDKLAPTVPASLEICPQMWLTTHRCRAQTFPACPTANPTLTACGIEGFPGAARAGRRWTRRRRWPWRWTRGKRSIYRNSHGRSARLLPLHARRRFVGRFCGCRRSQGSLYGRGLSRNGMARITRLPGRRAALPLARSSARGPTASLSAPDHSR